METCWTALWGQHSSHKASDSSNFSRSAASSITAFLDQAGGQRLEHTTTHNNVYLGKKQNDLCILSAADYINYIEAVSCHIYKLRRTLWGRAACDRFH